MKNQSIFKRNEPMTLHSFTLSWNTLTEYNEQTEFWHNRGHREGFFKCCSANLCHESLLFFVTRYEDKLQNQLKSFIGNVILELINVRFFFMIYIYGNLYEYFITIDNNMAVVMGGLKVTSKSHENFTSSPGQ